MFIFDPPPQGWTQGLREDLDFRKGAKVYLKGQSKGLK